MSAANRRVEGRRQPDDFRKVFAVATETALTLVTVVVVSRRLSGLHFTVRFPPAVPWAWLRHSLRYFRWRH